MSDPTLAVAVAQQEARKAVAKAEERLNEGLGASLGAHRERVDGQVSAIDGKVEATKAAIPALIETEAEAAALRHPGPKGDSVKGDPGKVGDPGAGFNWRGTWNARAIYHILDSVAHEGSSFVCTIETNRNQKPPGHGWDLLAKKGDPGKDSGIIRGGGGGGGAGGSAGTASDSVVTETAFGQASAAGASTNYSRGDHTHGTPADPGGGSGTPATTVTDETTYGIAPAVGDDTEYARQDHTHGSPSTPTAASVGAGPNDATYLVGAAHAGLSAEIVVGATPGGELGGTWASPTVDATHSGSSHAGVQAAAEATAAGALASHEADTSNVHGIVDTSALITATTFNDHSARHENGGADEISIAGLDGTSVELAAHLADAADAHDASAISVVPFSTIAATDVQAALEEVLAEAGGGAQTLYVQDADPGVVGAGKLWIDTTGPPSVWHVQIRTGADDAWLDLLDHYTTTTELALIGIANTVTLARKDGAVTTVELALTEGRADIYVRDGTGLEIGTFELGPDGFGETLKDDAGTLRSGLTSSAGTSIDALAFWEWLVKDNASVDAGKVRLDEAVLLFEAASLSVDIAGDTGGDGDVLTAQGDGTALWEAPAGGSMDVFDMQFVAAVWHFG